MMRIRCAGLLILLGVGLGGAQTWVVAPVRHEVVIRPGESTTFVVRVEREVGPGAPSGRVRFTAVPNDWDISRSGEVLLGPADSMSSSANAWMAYSPTGFILPPGGRQQIRVTVRVPGETPPGVYRAGLFFEEHSVLPPQGEGGGQVAIRFRLSTLVYVLVPPLEKKIAVRAVEVKGAPESGLSVHAVLENPGTVHLRPKHWVEVRDPTGKLLVRTDPVPTIVLLPGKELEVTVALPKDLPQAPSYQIRYFVDADRELPLRATTLTVGAVGSE